MPTSTFPSPDGTLGAIQIGFIVSTFLFGIVTLQTFTYYWNYPQDSVGLKLLIGVIWLLEVGHSICGWAGIYSISVTYYGQPQHILNPPAVLGFLPLFSAIPIVLVQWFFCLRIGRLSGRWHFARLLALFCAIPAVLTVVLVVMFQLGPGFATLETGKGRLLMTIATSLLPPGHILLAGALCYYLWQLRYPSEFERPRTIVDNIMIWTIETTLLICVLSFGYIILYLTRNDLSWMAFYVVHPKLLSNTMMASLNRRSTLRDEACFSIRDFPVSSGGQLEVDIVRPVNGLHWQTSMRRVSSSQNILLQTVPAAEGLRLDRKTRRVLNPAFRVYSGWFSSGDIDRMNDFTERRKDIHFFREMENSF